MQPVFIGSLQARTRYPLHAAYWGKISPGVLGGKCVFLKFSKFQICDISRFPDKHFPKMVRDLLALFGIVRCIPKRKIIGLGDSPDPQTGFFIDSPGFSW